MPFKKGIASNPKGRKPGVPNRRTSTMRETLHAALLGELENLKTDLRKMKPEDRWNILSRLLKYDMPALATISVLPEAETVPDEKTLDLEIKQLLIEAGYK